MNKVFLVGYEKETIEEFLEKLTDANVSTVIDVREIPLSRKNGFSGANLEKVLKEKGITYYHFQALGSPSKIRVELKRDGDYLRFFKAYRNYLKHRLGIVENLSSLINTKKHSALLCFERDCELCHRSIIASELIKMNPHLQVTPI